MPIDLNKPAEFIPVAKTAAGKARGDVMPDGGAFWTDPEGDALALKDVWIEKYVNADATETVFGKENPNARPAWLNLDLHRLAAGPNGESRYAINAQVDESQFDPNTVHFIVCGHEVTDGINVVGHGFWIQTSGAPVSSLPTYEALIVGVGSEYRRVPLDGSAVTVVATGIQRGAFGTNGGWIERDGFAYFLNNNQMKKREMATGTDTLIGSFTAVLGLNTICFGPDNTALTTSYGSNPGSLRGDLINGGLVLSYAPPNDSANSVAWNRDNNKVYVGSQKLQMFRHDLDGSNPETFVTPNADGIAYDGTRSRIIAASAAVSGNDSINFIDPDTMGTISTLVLDPNPSGTYIQGMAYDEGANTAYCLFTNGQVIAYDLDALEAGTPGTVVYTSGGTPASINLV